MPAIVNNLASGLPREHGLEPYLNMSETPEVNITELQRRRRPGFASHQPHQPNSDSPIFATEFSPINSGFSDANTLKNPVFGRMGQAFEIKAMSGGSWGQHNFPGQTKDGGRKRPPSCFLGTGSGLIRHIDDIETLGFAAGGVRVGSRITSGGDGTAQVGPGRVI